MEPTTNGVADSVQRANGRIWIDGLQGVDFGGSYLGRQDSQVACLTAALRCAGHDVTYSDVMGLSCAAFKLTLSPNIGLPEVHSEFGMDFKTFLREAFAMDYSNRSVIHDEPRTGLWRKAFIAQARPLIERGIPLIFMDGEWNLMVGFAEDGSGFLCLPYPGTNGRDYPFTPTLFGGCDGNAWGVYFLTPLDTPAKAHHQVVIESLHQAQRFANHAPQARGARDGLYWGFGAYEIWMDALEHRPEKTYPQCNGFSYSQLLTSRQAAADYLDKVAGEFDAANADRLRAAAGRYAAIAARLRAGSDCVATPYERTWNAANRAREIELLRQCLSDERAAVALIAQVAPLPAPTAAAPATASALTLLPTPGKSGDTTDFPLAPDVSLRAALIPSGEFLMGPKASGLTPGDQRRVILTRPFRMGVYPVTIGQFASFAADTGYVTDAEREGFAMAWVDGQGWVIKPGWSYKNPGYASDPALPAVCVTYNDAMAFCQWASRKTGRTVRLPTDAEREYACRVTALLSDPEGRKQDVIEALQRGRPSIFFSWDAGEYVLLKGCRPDGMVLSFYGGNDVVKPWKELGDAYTVRAGQAAPPAKVVQDALELALCFADRAKSLTGFHGYYANWPQLLDAGKKFGWAMSLTTRQIAELRRQAVEFLSIAAEKLAGRAADRAHGALEQYKAVAAAWQELSDLIPFPNRTNDQRQAYTTDPASVQRIRPVIAAIVEREAAGIERLQQIASSMA